MLVIDVCVRVRGGYTVIFYFEEEEEGIILVKDVYLVFFYIG